MNNKLLLLIEKHTDTLIEQTRTKPQETLEFVMSKQMQTFSFSPPINLIEEGKWLLGVTSFECTNSVFNITDENNSFSIIIPGSWKIPSYLEENVIDKLKNLLKPKSEKNIELHVQEVRKRGTKIKLGDNEYILSDFCNSKPEKLEELKNVKYNDLEDMVYILQLKYDEIIDVLELKYIPTKRIGYSLKPNIYQTSDINKTLKYILPDNVKINVTIGEKKLKANLKNNQTILFTDKSFFYTILGFTQSHSYPLDDIDGFYQLISGSYKNERPINFTNVDKVHLKCDCIDGSITQQILLFVIA